MLCLYNNKGEHVLLLLLFLLVLFLPFWFFYILPYSSSTCSSSASLSFGVVLLLFPSPRHAVAVFPGVSARGDFLVRVAVQLQTAVVSVRYSLLPTVSPQGPSPLHCPLFRPICCKVGHCCWTCSGSWPASGAIRKPSIIVPLSVLVHEEILSGLGDLFRRC